MAAADGHRMWDLSRRAASFLRMGMARLALTGAAAPTQLIAEGKAVDGHMCDPYYKSVSTEDDDLDSDGLWAEEDESELLVDDEDGGSTATRGGVSEIRTRGGGPLNRKSSPFIRHRPATTTAGAALRSEDVAAAAAESSEPLVPHQAAKRVNDAEMAGCDRRGSESSSLLLVSS